MPFRHGDTSEQVLLVDVAVVVVVIEICVAKQVEDRCNRAMCLGATVTRGREVASSAIDMMGVGPTRIEAAGVAGTSRRCTAAAAGAALGRLGGTATRRNEVVLGKSLRGWKPGQVVFRQLSRNGNKQDGECQSKTWKAGGL